MDLYITFNTESCFYNIINCVKIEYIISIKKEQPDLKFSKYEDGQICNTSVYSLSDDDHFSKITVPLNTVKLYFLMCEEHVAGGSYGGGLIIYIAPSFQEILEYATTYYECSHNITGEYCEEGLCKDGDKSICLKHTLNELTNSRVYDLECDGLEGTILEWYEIPL